MGGVLLLPSYMVIDRQLRTWKSKRWVQRHELENRRLDTGYLRRGANKGIEIRGPEGMKPRLTRLVNQICRCFTVAKKRVNAVALVAQPCLFPFRLVLYLGYRLVT